MNHSDQSDERTGMKDGDAHGPRRAVLIALPMGEETRSRREEFPTTPLMPLVDRSIVQHAMERLCDWGAEHIDVLGAATDVALKKQILDRDRWGVEVRWLNASGQDDCEPLRSIRGAGALLVGNTAAVPLHRLQEPRLHGELVALLSNAAATAPWAMVATEAFDLMPKSCRLGDLWNWLRDLHQVRIESDNLLPVHSIRALLSSQRRLLEQCAEEATDDRLQLIGRVLEPGIRVCRNVRIHPTAKLVGPVFVGDNSRIGKGAQVGPNTVIGANCIVDHHASVANALVESETYVGPWVEVYDCQVNQSEIANVRLQAMAQIDDPLVLSRV